MELVEILTPEDLQPLDMVDEGVWIHSLHWSAGRVFIGWDLATCFIDEFDGVKIPAWGEPIEKDPVFPCMVVRGAEPKARAEAL